MYVYLYNIHTCTHSCVITYYHYVQSCRMYMWCVSRIVILYVCIYMYIYNRIITYISISYIDASKRSKHACLWQVSVCIGSFLYLLAYSIWFCTRTSTDYVGILQPLQVGDCLAAMDGSDRSSKSLWPKLAKEIPNRPTKTKGIAFPSLHNFVQEAWAMWDRWVPKPAQQSLANMLDLDRPDLPGPYT